MTTIKRRARRIAADEAHSWARNLRLGNHHGKSVLRSLTLYVDGDGACFVGIDQLADDCELSPDTVRRRLTWLEEIGALSRLPQWIDARGVRNSDARGKRTTDLIRLQFDADEAEIEARARGEYVEENPTETTAFSPSSQQGLNSDQGSVSPAPGVGQPSHCGEGLISEPEPEPETPIGPQGDESEGADASEGEPEEFAAAWSAWPDHEIMRRDLALEAFRKLIPDKRRHCRAAIPMFVQMQQRAGRKHTPNFHLWIRNGGFEEFPAAAAGDAAVTATSTYAVDSAEGKAIKALFAFGGALIFEFNGTLRYPLAVTPRVLAFGDLPDRSGWHWIEGQQLAAWSAFLSSHIHLSRKDISTTIGEGAARRRGIYAPWPWPPRKDGTISETSGDAA